MFNIRHRKHISIGINKGSEQQDLRQFLCAYQIMKIIRKKKGLLPSDVATTDQSSSCNLVPSILLRHTTKKLVKATDKEE
ncbi:hypothetical protein SK128_019206 [Halocaridina rubra]|uniref:Uncharacterized protein n=1 Tax=Halocaridina rubra TaxID=373956 RepID=A0AAN8ZYW2_HALRR